MDRQGDGYGGGGHNGGGYFNGGGGRGGGYYGGGHQQRAPSHYSNPTRQHQQQPQQHVPRYNNYGGGQQQHGGYHQQQQHQPQQQHYVRHQQQQYQQQQHYYSPTPPTIPTSHQGGGNAYHHQQQQHQQHQQQQQQQTPQQTRAQLAQQAAAAAAGAVSSLGGVSAGGLGGGSVLSPTAQEFVPSSFMMPRDRQFQPQQQQHHGGGGGGGGYHHGRHGGGGGRGCGGRGAHHGGGGGGGFYSYDDLYDEDKAGGTEEDDALLMLQMFITDVTLSPGTYDSKVFTLADELHNVLRQNPPYTATIVSTIFESGVLQQNFRYSGARLCDHLSDRLVFGSRFFFRDELLAHAYKQVCAAKPVTGEKDRDREARGMALFCAELFSQLDLGHSIDLSELFPDFGDRVVAIMRALILSTDKDNQKNAIQALKLCGSNLEKVCASGAEGGTMDSLMAVCSEVEAREGTDSTICFMLKRLPQLREQQWGYVARPPKAAGGAAQGGPGAYHHQHTEVDNSQPAVMYGPDGQVLSPEEMSFLGVPGGYDMAQMQLDAYGQPMSLSQTGGGMDDEALDAYEQFLQETGQR